MSTLIDGASIRAVTQGIQVTRATATVAADADIFTVDGGNVLLVGFWGEVTTAIGAGSEDIAVAFDPDSGGSNVALASLVLVDAAAVGSFLTLNTTGGGALVLSVDVAYNAALVTPILLPPGDIVMDVTGTEAGSVEWNVIYVPLEAGAYVTAV